ncbi:MAG: type II toxin-antitoxin system RelE/ParE family toxin [Bryobacteraceae bacterium]
MARVLKREAAERDLISQWVWYAETGGIEIADRFFAAANSTLDLLATQPESGSPIWARKPELQRMRRFPVSPGFEKIFLFYFPLEDGVDLVRVVHGSRELVHLLAEGFFG